ncbi:hypothetical protein [Kribbella sp. VKM Ac-2568]|uniref:hypothetical protein n=1 Tax=Kribbella sp. VKM Ac-2568 TaxID=2512219 RepID=UPI0013050905|nr:hypothetical protein [Kribbella sp. VKM Ac-2568]
MPGNPRLTPDSLLGDDAARSHNQDTAPGHRPLTYDEIQLLFVAADDLVDHS